MANDTRITSYTTTEEQTPAVGFAQQPTAKTTITCVVEGSDSGKVARAMLKAGLKALDK